MSYLNCKTFFNEQEKLALKSFEGFKQDHKNYPEDVMFIKYFSAITHENKQEEI